MFSPAAIAALAASMAVMFGMAIVDEPMPVLADSPAITAELSPWLDQVESLRDGAEALSNEWHDASPAHETDVFAEHVEGFVELTEVTSDRIRALESGNDAACILHGMALDIGRRVEALGEAVDAAGKVEVLNGINRLLFEGLLIFGREQEARLETGTVIRVSAGSDEPTGNPHPYVEVDCDGNPIPGE